MDQKILLKKLEYYGIKDDEQRLMKSYFENRTQYIELDTKRSKVLPCPESSVVQGSKLSGILYTLYVNEVPKLHNLLTDKETMEKIAKSEPVECTEIEHNTVQFVDDSNSAISFNNEDKANEYLQAYYNLLSGYYNCQMLKSTQTRQI